MKKNKNTYILEGLTSYWDERAHSYSVQNVEEMNDWRQEAWRELILENAPDKRNLRILDVGCGPGFLAMTLALAGNTVTAIDVTEHMLRHAKINAVVYGAEVEFLLNRGEQLPFENETFDLIVSRNVVWNLEYPERAFTEWKRVLTPGGRIVYFDANWYLYLFDDALRKNREEHRKAVCKKHPEINDFGNLRPERVRDLERVAYSLPLSKEIRPEWDKAALEEIGMKICNIEEKIGRKVQLPKDYERDLPTPMFMICAEKEGICS